MPEDRIISITDFSALDTGPGGIPNSYLKDGDHHYCVCHNCKIRLCDVWITQPALKINSQITATCPKCKEKSIGVHVKGKFHLGATEVCDIVDMKYEYSDGEAGFINQKLNVIAKIK